MLFESDTSPEEILTRIKARLASAPDSPADPFRIAALSTVSGDQPASRYVVLREASENGFYLYTDSRSGKVSDLLNNPACCLLFYDAIDSVQVVVKGDATVHFKNAFARSVWENVPVHNRKSYTPVIAPGTKIKRPGEAHHWREELFSEFFTVICLVPSSVEVLQLNGHHHLRAYFSPANGWKGEWIAP